MKTVDRTCMGIRGVARVAVAVVAGLVCVRVGLLEAQEEAAATYAGPPENLHIYLLIGQSNMAGRAPFSEADAGVIDRCYLLNDQDRWEPASNPLNRYSTIRKGLGMQKLNPGYSFARRMLEQEADVSIGLVVNAKGGSSIDQWKKGSRFYAEAVRRAKEAQKTGTLMGILWHQGESNAQDPEGYLEQLTALVGDLRADLGIAELPFVAGQVHDVPALPFVAGQVHDVPAINAQIAALPEALPGTGFASAEGLTTMDRWHFDAASVKLLGERYADAMLKIHAR